MVIKISNLSPTMKYINRYLLKRDIKTINSLGIKFNINRKEN